MSMRTSDRVAAAGLLCLMLAACDRGAVAAKADTAVHGSAEAADMVDCAIGAQSGWSRDCVADRQGGMLILRHADGSFRRFHIVRDGRGLVEADGAEEAAVSIIGKRQVEIGIGEDRYHVPVTITAVAQP